jgi:alpha-L-rhamnosidase
MWERWDAVRADGSLHAGTMDNEDASSMTSFNHYAYGAVSAWLYRSVAGISVDPAHPGFGRISFEPQPGGDLNWASAQLTTVYGDAAIKWVVDADGFEAELLVPAGATAVFHCPSGFELPNGDSTLEFGSGARRLRARRSSNLQTRRAE